MEAICYLTCNKNISEMENRYNLLPSNHNFDRFILTDIKDGIKYSDSTKHHTFSFSEYIKSVSILRHTYIALVDFYLKNPNYEYYWLVEDDVVFKGDFHHFFNFYKDNKRDLIVPYFMTDLSSQNEWLKYQYNEINGPYFVKTPICGGLSIICRYSNKLLKEISSLTEKGVYGHLETFPHTVCTLNGFTIHSIKEDGFLDLNFCDWHHNWKQDDLINFPENKLIHAVKF